MTDNQITTALMAADLRAKGVNVIRAATDGTKKPLGQWKLFQSGKAKQEEVVAWFKDGYPGIGVVTGKVSGNLEMLEFEGRAVENGIYETFEQTCNPELLQKIKGWYERTPSGGYHFYYRTERPPPGNKKLAIDDDGLTLIETRGEGGFSIISPSNGTTHPNGKTWELLSEWPVPIPHLSEVERDNLFEVCRSFSKKEVDEPEEIKPQALSIESRVTTSDGLVDKGRKVADKFEWAELLTKYGYTFSHKDGDESFWFRPGKTKEDGSHSISINHGGNNRLINFSSSIPHFEPADPSVTKGTKSYNKLDLVAAYEFGGDVVAASRSLVGVSEGPPNLPDEFWNLSPVFQRVRQAAHARMNPADPVLAAVMWQVCYRMDHRILIPGDLKAHAAPNLFVALVGASGEGKGSSIKIANSLFPDEHPWDSEALVNNLGSGEGIAKAYYGEVEEAEVFEPHEPMPKPAKKPKEKVDPDKPSMYFDDDWEEPGFLVKSSKKAQKVKRIVRRHVAIRIDEGQQLESVGSRHGSTTFEVLRSAWSGERLGTQNADEARNFPVPENAYRLALIMGVQPGKAEYLIKDSEGGTPQRFIWADVEVDPTIPDPRVQRIPFPGQLDLRLPRYEDFPINHSHDEIRYFTVDEKITFDLLIAEYEKKTKRGNRPKELDSHRNLNKFKVAAIFAYMHGSTKITTEFWDWAEMFLQTSDGVRDSVIGHITAKAKAKEQAYRTRKVEEAKAVHEAVEDMAERKLGRIAKRLAEHVHSEHASDGCSKTCSSRFLGRDRSLREEATIYAIEKKWIKRVSDGSLKPGPSEPPKSNE